MILLKDIFKRLSSNKFQTASIALIAAFFSGLLVFFFSVYVAIAYQAKLITENSLGDIVITSVISGEVESILDLQAYSDFTRRYTDEDLRLSLIDPENLSFLNEDWVISYSGRLKQIDTQARILLPFEEFHMVGIATGVDFGEFSIFEKAMSGIEIEQENENGIIISESLALCMKENGVNVSVGDILRVEGDSFFIITTSWDYAAPYLYLKLLAILPDTGGMLEAGTLDRHDSISCYVDYESMQKIMGIGQRNSPNKKTVLARASKTDLSSINLMHPSIPKQPNSPFDMQPNQIFIRISDDIDIDEAIEIMNSELKQGWKNGHGHIAMRAEDFLELGSYQYPISKEIKSQQRQFVDDYIFYLCSSIVFMFLFFVLLNITDRDRMQLQSNLGASCGWQYRYVVIRDLIYTSVPGILGLIIGILFSFHYTEVNMGFHKLFLSVVALSYVLFLIAVFVMSSIIFLLTKRKKG